MKIMSDCQKVKMIKIQHNRFDYIYTINRIIDTNAFLENWEKSNICPKARN